MNIAAFGPRETSLWQVHAYGVTDSWYLCATHVYKNVESCNLRESIMYWFIDNDDGFPTKKELKINGLPTKEELKHFVPQHYIY